MFIARIRAGLSHDAKGALRMLVACCGLHALHDGFTDALYVFLPLWQNDFGLTYASIGLLRSLYTSAMAGMQLPVSLMAHRTSHRRILMAGTLLTGAAYLAVGLSPSFLVLAFALVIAGFGSSTQHPIAAALVSQAYPGRASRGALGTYNFAGDLGKAAIPAAIAWLSVAVAWRQSALLLGLAGLLFAAAASIALPESPAAPANERLSPPRSPPPQARVPLSRVLSPAFCLLLSIGIIDTATRMGFLTFLPFLLEAKGADLTTIGLALSLVFIGGAAGKLVCGFLGGRIGVVGTVLATESLTALGVVALIPMTMTAGLVVMPLIGVALNGTSSVLYGTVPELVPASSRERAFGVFYTGVLGAGALAPILYGLASDRIGVPPMMALIAGLVLLTLPLVWLLGPFLLPLESDARAGGDRTRA